jgi:uncharacterized protein YggE
MAGLFAKSANAQAKMPDVTGLGHATLTAKPEILRIKIMLTADGKDAHEAMTALAAKRTDLKQKLVATGAAEASVQISDVTGGTGDLTPQQQQIQMIMAAQRRGGAAAPTAPSVTLSCTVKAEFAVPGGTGDDAFLATSDLEDKISALVSTDSGAKKPMTPEQQEIAEEAAAGAGANGAATPGKPTFIFVHKLTDAEQAKLMSDAVASAKAQAGRLAAAAGAALGPIENVSAGDTANSAAESIYAIEMQQMNGNADELFDKATECAGPTPEAVISSADVTVTYFLK